MSRLIPLIDAIIHGDLESLTSLAADLPQDQLNSALLRCFMFSEDPTVLSILVDAGANINHQDQEGRSAIFLAVKYMRIDVVQLLIQLGCNVNLGKFNHSNCLHLAARRGNVEIVQMLLDVGHERNATNWGGNTALLIACRFGHTDVVECLLLAGCDPMIPNKLGHYPLHYAAFTGKDRLAEVLLSHGACADVRTHLGIMPVMLACERGHCDIVKRLACRSDLSHREALYGGSALHWAVAAGCCQCVKHLLAAASSTEELNPGGGGVQEGERVMSSTEHMGGECNVACSTLSGGVSEQDGGNSTSSTQGSYSGKDNEPSATEVSIKAAAGIADSIPETATRAEAESCSDNSIDRVLQADESHVHVEKSPCSQKFGSTSNSSSSEGDCGTVRDKANSLSSDSNMKQYYTLSNPVKQETCHHSASLMERKPISECCGSEQSKDGGISYTALNLSSPTIFKRPSLNSVYTIDLSGRTPLLQAVQSRRPTVISILLEVTDLMSPSNPDVTVLHMAAACGYRECVETLCSSPRSKHLINTRDCFGDTPLDLATKTAVSDERPTPEVVDVIDVLLRHGAERSYEGPLYAKKAKAQLSHSDKFGARNTPADVKVHTASGLSTAHDAENSNAAYFEESAVSNASEVNSNVDFLRQTSDQDRDDGNLAADLQCMNLTEIRRSLISIVNNTDSSEIIPSAQSPSDYAPMQPVFKTYSPVKMALIEMLRSASCEQMVAPSRFDFATWLDTGPEAFVLKVTSLDMTDWLYKQTHSPWSLRELCRGAVRRTLGYRAHEKVQLLPLPKTLQNYLNMTELEEINTKDISIRSSMSYEDVDME